LERVEAGQASGGDGKRDGGGDDPAARNREKGGRQDAAERETADRNEVVADSLPPGPLAVQQAEHGKKAVAPRPDRQRQQAGKMILVGERAAETVICGHPRDLEAPVKLPVPEQVLQAAKERQRHAQAVDGAQQLLRSRQRPHVLDDKEKGKGIQRQAEEPFRGSRGRQTGTVPAGGEDGRQPGRAPAKNFRGRLDQLQHADQGGGSRQNQGPSEDQTQLRTHRQTDQPQQGRQRCHAHQGQLAPGQPPPVVPASHESHGDEQQQRNHPDDCAFQRRINNRLPGARSGGRGGGRRLCAYPSRVCRRSCVHLLRPSRDVPCLRAHCLQAASALSKASAGGVSSPSSGVSPYPYLPS